MTRFLLLLLLLAELLLAEPALAAVKYVDGTLVSDCSGNYSIANRNCTGSDGDAWNTIAEGLANITAGDTLNIRAGTYTTNPTVSVSGTSSSKITIQGYLSETVTLRGIFTVSNRSWLDIKNITQVGAVSGIYGFLFDGASNITFDNVHATGNSNSNFRGSPSINNITIKNCTASSSVTASGIAVGQDPGTAGGVTNLLVEDCTIANNADDGIVCIGCVGVVINRVALTGNGEEGVDFKGDTGDSRNIEIKYSDIQSNSRSGILFNENHGWRNVTIHHSHIANNGTHGIEALGFSALQAGEVRRIYNNLLVQSNSTKHHIVLGAPNASWEHYNNTFIGGARGIDQRGGPSAVIKNNIFINQSAAALFFVDNDAPTTITEDYNLFYRADAGVVIDWKNGATYTAAQFATYQSATSQGANSIAGSDPLLISSTTGGLQATSPAINAGVAVPTAAHNGSAPDMGDRETIVCTSAEVGLIDATSLIITCENNVNPPILPATGIAGFSVEEDTGGGFAAVTVSSAARTGTNLIDLTLGSAITTGSTVRFSYSTGTGNVTDSALIGGTKNQRLNAITNQAVVNNVEAAAPSHVFEQKSFQFYGVRTNGGLLVKLPHSAAAVNANINTVPGGSVIIAIQIDGTTANPPPIGVIPYYSKNSGGYAIMPGSFGADNIRIGTSQTGSDIPSAGEAVTTALSGALTTIAGQHVTSANAIPTFDLAQDNSIVNRWVIEFDTDVSAGDTYDIRLYNQDTNALDTYTVTPRIEIIGDRAGGGAS